MVEAWERIDRDELLVAASRAVANHQILVIEGQDVSGRSVAANLLEEFLETDLGEQVIRVRGRGGRPDEVRQRFLDAWQRAARPLGPGALGPWITERSFISERQVIESLSAEIGSRSVSFIFDTVDAVNSLPPGIASLFVLLGETTKRPVFVFSRSESRTKWPGASTKLRLGPMTLDDVRNKLYPAHRILGIELPTLDSVMDQLSALAGAGGRVDARDVYDIVSSELLGV